MHKFALLVFVVDAGFLTAALALLQP